MVAMPYILVNFVLETLSFILFSTTSAALLSKYRVTNRYLPAQIRDRRPIAFLAQCLVVSALSIVVVLVVARGRSVFILAQPVFEWFCYLGVANSVVLTHQVLERRWLLGAPKVPRRLLIALCAVVMVLAAAVAVVAVVIRLFLIK